MCVCARAKGGNRYEGRITSEQCSVRFLRALAMFFRFVNVCVLVYILCMYLMNMTLFPGIKSSRRRPFINIRDKQAAGGRQ